MRRISPSRPTASCWRWAAARPLSCGMWRAAARWASWKAPVARRRSHSLPVAPRWSPRPAAHSRFGTLERATSSARSRSATGWGRLRFRPMGTRWPPAMDAAKSSCGMPRKASSWACSQATPAGCKASSSRPMAAFWPPAQWISPSGCGTWQPGARPARSWDTPGRWTASHSPLTARCWLRHPGILPSGCGTRRPGPNCSA